MQEVSQGSLVDFVRQVADIFLQLDPLREFRPNVLGMCEEEE